MKYVLEISNVRVVLSHTQLEIIAETISGSDTLVKKYVGTKQADGSNYATQIETQLLHEWFKPTVIEDDYVDALKLAAKLQEGQ
jgi:hypothetical protein